MQSKRTLQEMYESGQEVIGKYFLQLDDPEHVYLVRNVNGKIAMGRFSVPYNPLGPSEPIEVKPEETASFFHYSGKPRKATTLDISRVLKRY